MKSIDRTNNDDAAVEHAVKSETLDYKNALIKVAGTPEGRLVLRKLFDDTQIFKDTFRKDASSVYADGKKSIGYPIFNIIKDADPVMLLPLISDKWISVQAK